MAAGAESRDVTIRVNLDVTKAEQTQRKLEGNFSRMGSALSRRLMQTLGGAMTGMLGAGAAAMTAPMLRDFGSIVGAGGGVVGREASRTFGLRDFASTLSAEQAAMDRTTETLGLAGKGMSDEQINGIYGGYLRIERLREASRKRVEDVLDKEGTFGKHLYGAQDQIAGLLTQLLFAVRDLRSGWRK